MVIPVNTSFDTIIDENITKIEKPLVSSKTIHGKWLKEMMHHKISIEKIDTVIEEKLRNKATEKILSRDEKKRGKLKHYKTGTIVPFQKNNTVFLLVALSEFDENNKAGSIKKDVIKCMQSIMKFCVNKGQGYSIYIPLMGTGLSKANLSHKESLQFLKSYLLLHEEHISSEVNIVIYDKDKVSIFD